MVPTEGKSQPLHVLHTFANNDHVPYLSWFAERAAQEGDVRYTFLLMHPTRPSMIDEMQAYGFACEWIRYDPAHRKRGFLAAIPALWRHMRRHRPDIVHCNLFDDTLPGLIAARAAGVRRRVTTKQDTGYHYLVTPRWMRFDRWINRMSTHLIAISHECGRFIVEQEGAPPEKVNVVHNGVPPELFTAQREEAKAAMRQRFALDGRYPVVGSVARFIPWKGHDHIIDAAALVVRKHPKAIFLLCGQGDELERLRGRVAEAGLQDHVVFTGWVDRRDMASFYGSLDIFMHAAVLEPFGLVYAEAMMNAVPVVSTATGAALDAIEDGRNGIIVHERSGVALAAGVDRLLAGDARAVGAAGRDTAMRMFPFDLMRRGTMEVYRKAMQELP